MIRTGISASLIATETYICMHLTIASIELKSMTFKKKIMNECFFRCYQQYLLPRTSGKHHFGNVDVRTAEHHHQRHLVPGRLHGIIPGSSER